MKPSLRTSVILALAQTGLLVVGILAVATSNRVAHQLGYPDLRDFLFFMNQGWLLMPLPIIWMAVAGRVLLSKDAHGRHETAVFVSGMALLMVLAAALTLEAIEPWRASKPHQAATIDLEN
jgi:hypothetical protein